MAKISPKANPEDKRGTEPGEAQLEPRRDRQNTGNGNGGANKAQNQGRQKGMGARRDSKREKGDSRRSARK